MLPGFYDSLRLSVFALWTLCNKKSVGTPRTLRSSENHGVKTFLHTSLLDKFNYINPV